MKKIFNFLANTKKGQGIILGMAITIITSTIIGLVVTVPVFWMNPETYNASWMNQFGVYFFYPVLIHGALVVFLFSPYMLFITRGSDYKQNGSSIALMRGMSLFLGIFAGGIIWGNISNILDVPQIGIWSLIPIFVCGFIYVWAMSHILKRPFSIAKEFAPLT